MANGGRSFFILGLSALAASTVLTAPARAQVNAPTREEIERPVSPPAEQRSRLSVEGDIERAPCPLADPAYANIPLTLSSVRFNNLGPVAPSELNDSFAQYIGTTQPVSVLCDIRDAAATKLRRMGYLAAVQVPTQRIENGEVQFEVLFARIEAVRVRGNAGRSERLIAGYLDRLTEDPVFNQNSAERYLLLARDLPGFDVRLTLTPAGTKPGDLIAEVTVRRSAHELEYNFQNMAARDAGPYGHQLKAQFFGLTGMGDRTYVSAYSTLDFEEQQIVQLGHDFRLGSEGLSLAGRFIYAWTSPDISGFPGVSIDAKTLYANVEARYPLIRQQDKSVWASGGLDFVDQQIDFIGPLSRDKLRVAYARLAGEAIDLDNGAKPRWRLSGNVELRQGLDILGASAPCRFTCALVRTPTSRPDGDPTSSLVRGEMAVEASLGDSLSVFVRSRGQLAFDPLLSFEEISGGNYTIGRGYDPGSVVGDDGVGYQVELRGPQLAPFGGFDLAFQPFLFNDVSWIWDDTRGSAFDPQRLVSFGGGVRARIGNRFRFDLMLAVPTERFGLLNEKPDPRLLFTFTTLLLPWGDR